jgi:hypothetical protein
MRATTAAILLVLALVPGAALAEDMNVVGQALGNSDVILVHVGLSEPNNVASWGLAVAHKPETTTIDQSTSFGVWGALSTQIQLVQPGTLGLWAGLTAKPFLSADVLYDFDNQKISVWPGAGVRLAPTKTLAFVAQAIYPLGDEGVPSPVDYNTFAGLFGLEIQF